MKVKENTPGKVCGTILFIMNEVQKSLPNKLDGSTQADVPAKFLKNNPSRFKTEW